MVLKLRMSGQRRTGDPILRKGSSAGKADRIDLDQCVAYRDYGLPSSASLGVCLPPATSSDSSTPGSLTLPAPLLCSERHPQVRRRVYGLQWRYAHQVHQARL